MDPHAGKIVLNGAPSQHDRWRRALDAAWAQVDGRSLAELLDFAVRFGRLIRFYDLRDQPDGDWVEFFLADPTMVLASIGAADLADREAAFAALVRETAAERSFERKFALLREAFAAVLALARQSDGWLRALAGSPDSEAARNARQEMEATITGSLGEALRRLKAFDLGAARPAALGQPIGLDYSGFLPLWDLDFVGPDSSVYDGATGNRRIDHALPHLTALFHTLLDGSADFQSFARESLSATLAEGWHKPQIALYIAFAELFRTAQDTINTLSSRFLRFYYDDVLRARRLPAVPDSVYLTFTLAEDETRANVPQGTLFPAGQDADGNDVLYAADRGLTVTAARLDRIRTLRVLSSPVLPGSPDGAIVNRQILATEIVPGGEPWPTFGGTAAGAEPAALGFALASEYLLLTGGERHVKITVVGDTKAAQETLRLLLDTDDSATAQAFRDVLKGAFAIDLSTAAGWFRLDDYEVLPLPESWDGFTLALDLPAAAPPIVPFAPEDSALGEPSPAPALPTLEAWLRQEPITLTGANGATAEVYPLSLLGEIKAVSFEIYTHVTGLPELTLANTDGEIDPSSPFPLFGAAPVTGSYLEIRHPELFAKVPESLAITVRWFGLPPNDDGFKGWYRDYVLDLNRKHDSDLFDNTRFRGVWSVRKPGAWTLQDALCSEPPYLFRTQNACSASSPTPDGKLRDATVFDHLEVRARAVPPYYDPAASAIRLELTQPSYAFGNDLYAINVLHAVIEDLPDVCPKPSPKKDLKYPNEPWLPQAQSVTLTYSARCTLTPGETSTGRFFHLLPFGGSQPAPAADVSLLPQFPAPGNLYLGFSGLAPAQRLSLLFQMTAGRNTSHLPPVAWSRLTNDTAHPWQPLALPEILSDTTNGLENSGILALSLPACDPAADTILPGGFRWLRATVARDPGHFPLTTGIYPHVLTATRQSGAGSGETLPAHTITSSLEDLASIAGIDQPMESFGGRPPEDPRALDVRLGERLRHKDRALLAWDYERLVLERFPEVWKVQALPARNAVHGNVPGDVLVVVVPGAESRQVQDPTMPLAPADLLHRIQTYLEARTSPFVRLHVVNPHYVRIQITATVTFRNEDDPGADIAKLNADLVQYLSPWYDDAARAAKEGGYATEDEISEFVQTRPYVATLESISYSYDPPDKPEWYFLTSAAGHLITAQGSSS